MKHINRGPFLSHTIDLPPLNEQRRIVAKLESIFARTRRAREELEKIQKLCDRYKQAVLSAACTGKLTADWRENNPNIESALQILKTIQHKHRATWEKLQIDRMRLKGQIPLGDAWKLKYQELKEINSLETENLDELPAHWCYTLIKSILSTQRRGMKTGPFGSALKKEEHLSEGVPVLGIDNISSMKFVPEFNTFISPEKAKCLSEYDAQAGDVLISRSGTVGEVCVVPDGLGEARISTNLIRIALEPYGMLPIFFCMLFNGSPLVLQQISSLCSGSTRDFLNQDILSSIVFPLPPLPEQQEIIQRIETIFKSIDRIEQEYQKALKLCERLEQAALAKAFRGELVPQDPNDEPASVLLERIAAEKQQTAKPPKKSRTKTPQIKQLAIDGIE